MMAMEQRGDDLSGSGGGDGKPNLWGNGSWLRDGESDRSRHTLDIRHFFLSA